MLNPETELRQADILLIFMFTYFNAYQKRSIFIQTSSPSVHADQNGMSPEFRYEVRAGKLASLIRIIVLAKLTSACDITHYANKKRKQRTVSNIPLPECGRAVICKKFYEDY